VAILGASGGGAPPIKTSGIGHLVFLGLCWKSCNRFQVVTFSAGLAQFWGSHFGGLAGVPHHLKRLPLVICYSWDYAGHLATGCKLPFQLI